MLVHLVNLGMSFLMSDEKPCSHCQFPNPVEIWSIVNVKEDPELKDLILGGEFNMAECTSCRKIFYAEHFVLYHDPDAELMAFVYPFENKSEREKFETKTAEDFSRFQEKVKLPYPPVTLFGLDELVRLVEEEDESGIQGEIVATLAPSLSVDVKRLRPTLARQQKLPMVLPYESGFDNAALIRALEKVMKENNLLSVYSSLHDELVKNPSTGIKFE